MQSYEQRECSSLTLKLTVLCDITQVISFLKLEHFNQEMSLREWQIVINTPTVAVKRLDTPCNAVFFLSFYNLVQCQLTWIHWNVKNVHVNKQKRKYVSTLTMLLYLNKIFLKYFHFFGSQYIPSLFIVVQCFTGKIKVIRIKEKTLNLDCVSKFLTFKWIRLDMGSFQLNLLLWFYLRPTVVACIVVFQHFLHRQVKLEQLPYCNFDYWYKQEPRQVVSPAWILHN